ncbi:gluconate 2-dehydrogenase subunit 3 family protein [Larkinella humicola]|uniref:Gluconate 2-dehydrogenase subunit 3 family protein n=1 Tax=Larkinella humicola TaxID=2607654 RepID=A0A5N1JPB4_9BACT|nr:gluconate 2-dehydrogenase subunit 3 family protein [Larkinella humicola]
MRRREALQRLALLVGATLSLPVQAALRGETTAGVPLVFSEAQQRLMADLADVILPSTDTPGAKDAGVHQFIGHVIGHCTAPAQQELFLKGLQQTDALSQTVFRKPFSELDSPQRTEVVRQLTQREKPFFLTLRELTIVGYFTSETGATKTLAYLPIPGRFQGDLPLKPGQKVWAL